MKALMVSLWALIVCSVNAVAQDAQETFIIPSWGLVCILDRVESSKEGPDDPVRFFLNECANKRASILLPRWMAVEADDEAGINTARLVAAAIASAMPEEAYQSIVTAPQFQSAKTGRIDGAIIAVSGAVDGDESWETAAVRAVPAMRWLGMVRFEGSIAHDERAMSDKNLYVRAVEAALAEGSRRALSEIFVPIQDVEGVNEESTRVLDLAQFARENGVERYAPVMLIEPSSGGAGVSADTLYRLARMGVVIDEDGNLRGVTIPSYMNFRAAFPSKIPESDHPNGLTMVLEFQKDQLDCIESAHEVMPDGNIRIPRRPCDD